MLKKVRLKLAFVRLQKNLEVLREDLTSAELLEFIFSKEGALISPWQYRDEFTALVHELEILKPKHALEIGTANGGTLFMLCRIAHPMAKIMSIDLPEGRFGGGYPDWKMPLYQAFAWPSQKLLLAQADSHQADTHMKALDFFGEDQLDYLFIDGDHSYEGVKQDFDMYSPMVRKGGMIVFHDIVKHPDSQCAVDKFWKEIKVGRTHKEFVNDWDQGQYGIGVIYN